MRNSTIASFGLAVFVTLSGCATKVNNVEALVSPLSEKLLSDTKATCQKLSGVECEAHHLLYWPKSWPEPEVQIYAPAQPVEPTNPKGIAL